MEFTSATSSIEACECRELEQLTHLHAAATTF